MRLQTICLLGSAVLPMTAAAAFEPTPPPVILANAYAATEVDVREYCISEKYDGIRAYWDGAKLVTRGGQRIHAPAWFTAGWPTEALDGELWMGRGHFEGVAATVRDVTPDETGWRQIRYMAFDLPARSGSFLDRSSDLTRLISELGVDWLQATAQFRVADEEALYLALDRIVAAGGEGLMLRHAFTPYRAGRSDDLLKLKRTDDAEARVVGHVEGKGKYRGMLGALEVELSTGLRFRLGTGFTDHERRHPPPLGSWVTFGYQGVTENGVPRFARFVRMRSEE